MKEGKLGMRLLEVVRDELTHAGWNVEYTFQEEKGQWPVHHLKVSKEDVEYANRANSALLLVKGFLAGFVHGNHGV